MTEIITKLNNGIAEITAENVYDHIQKGDLRPWLDDWQDNMIGHSLALYTLLKIKTKEEPLCW